MLHGEKLFVCLSVEALAMQATMADQLDVAGNDAAERAISR